MQPLASNYQSAQSATSLDNTQPLAGIKVAGNTISWASNGWHEVQYAASGNTISEGGQSASVGPGTYNVINHTTGERFENITIGQDNGRVSQRSSLDTLRDSPSTTDILSAHSETSASTDSTAQDVNQQSQTTEKADSNDQPVVISWPSNWVYTDTINTTTATPEDDWGETLQEAAWAGVVAGVPGGIGWGLAAGGGQLAAGTDFETEAQQVPSFSPIVMFLQAILDLPNMILGNSPAASNNTGSGITDSDPGSAQAAADEYSDGDLGGEYGGLEDTYPSENNTGSGTTDSGLSTSLEAANEYSNGNVGGEYGGTPTAPQPVTQQSLASNTPSDTGSGTTDSGTNADSSTAQDAADEYSDGDLGGEFGGIGPGEGSTEATASESEEDDEPETTSTNNSGNIGSGNTDGETNSNASGGGGGGGGGGGDRESNPGGQGGV